MYAPKIQHLCLALPIALFACNPALAQRSAPPSDDHKVYVDSTWLRNDGTTPRVVFSTVVKIPKAPWLRLFFEQTNLPAGSKLTLTSLQDNAVQSLDALSLADYGNSTCYFNGEAVRLDLVAGPKTVGNRVLLTRVCAGIAGVGSPQTICGSTDDRKQSFDRRQGRLSSGCTAWLNNSDVMVTAGHCITTGTMILSFNVPNSWSSGAIKQSAPNDQYPVISSTIKRLAAGVGADWAVARMGKNSNTRKLPGDAQGGWYTIGAVPTTTSGNNIRITGYGTTSPRNYLNQVQKTHVGPMYGRGATFISYRTDTTGGNSGSPVIHENARKVVGIHTHGGCTTSPTSRNYGTRIDRSDIVSALRGLHGQPGKSEPFGLGCLGSNGKRPSLTGSSNPQIGRLAAITVRNLLPLTYGFFVFGTSNTKAKAGYALPFELKILGMTGCYQYTSVSVIQPIFSVITGVTGWIGYIPRDANMIGTAIYTQYYSHDARANAGRTVSSNGLKITIGG